MFTLDNDGQFDDAVGVTPTFSAAGLDGFSGAAATVRLRVTDAAGASDVSTATVNVANANPAPAIDSVGGNPVEGTAVTVVGSATDPAGTADTLTYAWAVYKDGSPTPFATGGGSPAFTFTPTADGSYTVILTVSDEDGGSGSTSQSVRVRNVAPAVALSGPAVAVEGQTRHYTFTTTDPGADTFTVAAIGGGAVGAVSNLNYDPATGAGGFDVTFADGPVTSTVSVQVRDSDGDVSNTAAVAVAVANLAPTVALTGVAGVNQGATYTLTLSHLIDPGADTPTGVTVNWGDGATTPLTPGQVVTLRNGSPVQLQHPYVEGGTFTVTATVADEDGAFGPTTVPAGGGSRAVAVTSTSGATLEGGRLVIVGTSGNDDIKVNPGGGPPRSRSS